MHCPFHVSTQSEPEESAAAVAEGCPAYDEDFYDDDFIRTQFSHFEKMRELGPLVWMPRQNAYALTRYDEVRTALQNWEVFSSAAGVAGDDWTSDFIGTNTLASDPPLHGELRRISSTPLRPTALRQHGDAIQAAADRLIDDLVERSEFDAVADFARHLPLRLVTDFVGLPEDGRDNMLVWASAQFNILGAMNERGRAALNVVKERGAWLADRLDPGSLRPGSWTDRLYKLGLSGEIPADYVKLIQRDYLTPSLDTTIAATSHMIWQLGRNPEVWEALRADPDLIAGAVHEAVRLCSPVRSFTRKLMINYEVAGVMLPAGTRVMMLYASANYDERKFPDPQRFDPLRPQGEHLGFGNGVHMCEGMHLAQLEMQSLLRAMVERVSTIEVGEPELAYNNTIYGFQSLPAVLRPRVPDSADRRVGRDGWMTVTVAERQNVADGVVSLVLEAPEGTTLPEYTPGSHIDVDLGDGVVRQYSLCGAPTHGGKYRIAVLLEAASKAGSLRVHANLFPGVTFDISRPRNLFELDSSAAGSLLLAGGIGITPLLAMAYELQRRGDVFELHYTARSPQRMSFRGEIRSQFGDQAKLYAHGADGTRVFELERILAGASVKDHIYCCGPSGFIDFVLATARAAGWPEANLHAERFSLEIPQHATSFTATAARSGVEVRVREDQTLLQALLDAGVDAPYSCESGICRTCVTSVLSGVPEHHDQVLTEEERASGTKMAICCSRAASEHLDLDI